MSQPSWKLIDSTDFYAIFEDQTKVYPPEIEVASLIKEDPDEDRQKYALYRFSLEQVAPGKREWFMDSLGQVASSVGRTERQLLADLASSNVRRRAAAYLDIGGYHGFDNFDTEPRVMSGSELTRRW